MYSQSNVTEFPTSWLGEKKFTRLSKLNSESKNAAEAGSILIIFKSLHGISGLYFIRIWNLAY